MRLSLNGMPVSWHPPHGPFWSLVGGERSCRGMSVCLPISGRGLPFVEGSLHTLHIGRVESRQKACCSIERVSIVRLCRNSSRSCEPRERGVAPQNCQIVLTPLCSTTTAPGVVRGGWVRRWEDVVHKLDLDDQAVVSGLARFAQNHTEAVEL